MQLVDRNRVGVLLWIVGIWLKRSIWLAEAGYRRGASYAIRELEYLEQAVTEVSDLPFAPAAWL